jgi:hypothetical protein
MNKSIATATVNKPQTERNSPSRRATKSISIEQRFHHLFIHCMGISKIEIEWQLRFGEDDALRRQEANVKAFLDIAYNINCENCLELAETVDNIKRNGLAYRDCMRKFRLLKIAKSRRHQYIVTLSQHHDAMVADCRRLCAAAYPERLQLFDICFRINEE